MEPRCAGLRRRGAQVAIANAVRHAGEGSVAGIDIGGTKITVGIVNEAGAILVRADASISVEDGPKRALADIVEILNRHCLLYTSSVFRLSRGSNRGIWNTLAGTGKLLH